MLSKLAAGLAANRVLYGIGFLAAPRPVAGGWIGPAAMLPPVKVLTRAVGARDLVLGAGALAALADERADPRPWFAAQLVCDATDFLATRAAGRTLPKRGRRFGLVMAGASTAIAAAATFGLGSDVGPGGGDAVAGEVRPTA